MNLQSPPQGSWQSLLAGRAGRLLAVLLFLVLAWLTIPKLAPRMFRIFSQREGRASIIRQQAADAGIALSEEVRSSDIWLIVAAAAGGAALLGGLGYVALGSTSAEANRAGAGNPHNTDSESAADAAAASRKGVS